MNWRSVKPLVSNDIIDEYEKTINYHFPDSFREFVKINNGGKPSHKVFNTKVVKERVFDNLLSFNKDDVDTIWHYNDWKGDMSDWYKFSNGEVENYIAFACDAFGNLICFDKRNDSVVWIDHETMNVEFVAKSFTEFIESLHKS